MSSNLVMFNLFSFQIGNFKQAFNESNIGGLGLKNNSLLTSTPLFKNQNSGIGYPEVTLHPIGQSSHAALLQNQKNNNDHLPDAHNSLLHGILTKVISSFKFNCNQWISNHFFFRAQNSKDPQQSPRAWRPTTTTRPVSTMHFRRPWLAC